MRAAWPALWIEKFTDHTAKVISSHESMSNAHDALLDKTDVLVLHRATPQNHRLAKVAKDKGVPFVYDTDDLETNTFLNHYVHFYAMDLDKVHDYLVENAAMLTVASHGLEKHYAYHNAKLIENGFDTTLPQFQPRSRPHVHGHKIAWGGSSTHMRDIEHFLRSTVVDEICKDYSVRFCFYGLVNRSMVKRIGESEVCFYPMSSKGIEWYMHDFYSDATILIAPLLPDAMNSCRSTLKIVEAGVMGKTIVAQDTVSNRHHEGGALLARTPAEWYTAISDLLEDEDKRISLSQLNHESSKNYTAEKLTEKRIKLFEEIYENRS